MRLLAFGCTIVFVWTGPKKRKFMYANQGHLESRTKVEKEQDIHQREVSLYKSWVKLCCKRKEVSEFFFIKKEELKKKPMSECFAEQSPLVVDRNT